MKIRRLPIEIIKEYKKLDTSSITDALDKQGIVGGLLGIKGVVNDTRACGQAFTVHYVPCGINKGTVGDFLDDVQEGDVVVIDNSGREYCTVWGDIMSQVAKEKRIAGTVIDGVCRDVKTIREIKYPIFTKGIYMMTGKDRVEADAINIPVGISGVKVCPGDLIVADENGVVCIPISSVKETLEIAKSIEATEVHIVNAVKGGKTLKEARAEMGYHTLQTKAID
ncbi:RraA family protein [Clostridium sp. MT-14]|uniref:Putative 4-hydroxy-4-methyl-2-oxoglutarate aldolase n=1 Tax=Clostridium aromativorans TaxID=2836848 RepID=A0ABS8N8U5_9CLOT|nr:RraA family protein [Clostridium aromativorans]MCC9296235.1 RraA family protein [Clostridium aromativorans]